MDQVRAFQHIKVSGTGRHVRETLRVHKLHVCIITSAYRIRENERVTDVNIPDMVWISLQVSRIIGTLEHCYSSCPQDMHLDFQKLA